MIHLPKQPMTTEDVADLLGVLPDSVRGVARGAAAKGHPMPQPVKVGGMNLWEREDVVTWASTLPERKPGNPNWIRGRQRPA